MLTSAHTTQYRTTPVNHLPPVSMMQMVTTARTVGRQTMLADLQAIFVSYKPASVFAVSCSDYPCSIYARCTDINEAPGAMCSCYRGYEGDGVTCLYDSDGTVRFIGYYCSPVRGNCLIYSSIYSL